MMRVRVRTIDRNFGQDAVPRKKKKPDYKKQNMLQRKKVFLWLGMKRVSGHDMLIVNEMSSFWTGYSVPEEIKFQGNFYPE